MTKGGGAAEETNEWRFCSSASSARDVVAQIARSATHPSDRWPRVRTTAQAFATCVGGAPGVCATSAAHSAAHGQPAVVMVAGTGLHDLPRLGGRGRVVTRYGPFRLWEPGVLPGGQPHKGHALSRPGRGPVRVTRGSQGVQVIALLGRWRRADIARSVARGSADPRNKRPWDPRSHPRIRGSASRPGRHDTTDASRSDSNPPQRSGIVGAMDDELWCPEAHEARDVRPAGPSRPALRVVSVARGGTAATRNAAGDEWGAGGLWGERHPATNPIVLRVGGRPSSPRCTPELGPISLARLVQFQGCRSVGPVIVDPSPSAWIRPPVRMEA